MALFSESGLEAAGKKGKKAADDRANIKRYIDLAVQEGIRAGLEMAEKKERAAFNAYRATEERLYALPTLRVKVEKDKEDLLDIQEHGIPQRSKDICRFQRDGLRLDHEDILDALIRDLTAKIAADEYEIEIMTTALDTVKEDDYYRALTGRYFDNIGDKAIAVELKCDDTTVWRNRSRLVRRVAVRLYGVEAIGQRQK